MIITLGRCLLRRLTQFLQMQNLMEPKRSDSYRFLFFSCGEHLQLPMLLYWQRILQSQMI